LDDPGIAIRNFDQAEVRTFPRGRFELCELGGHVIGRARYQPGWRWTRDLGQLEGTSLCQHSHVGVVITGQAAVRMADGREFTLRAGDATAGWSASSHTNPSLSRALTATLAPLIRQVAMGAVPPRARGTPSAGQGCCRRGPPPQLTLRNRLPALHSARSPAVMSGQLIFGLGIGFAPEWALCCTSRLPCTGL
jgi:hypothetical protein